MLFLHGIDVANREQLLDLIYFLEGPGFLNINRKIFSYISSKFLISNRIGKNQNISNNLEKKRNVFREKNIFELRSRVKHLIYKLSGTPKKYSEDTNKIADYSLKQCSLQYGIKGQIKDFAELERVLVKRYLRDIGDKLEEFLLMTRPDDLKRFSHKFNDEIKKYGYVDQNLLSKELNSKKITLKAFSNLLSDTMTLGTGIFLIKSMGFSAFIGLSKVIFYFGSTLGISFPFVIYTGASSLLGFLLGPLGTVMLILGVAGGALFKNYNLLNRQRLILTVIVLHSILNDYQGSKRQLLTL